MNREDRRALRKRLRDKKSRTFAANVLGNLGDEIDNKIHDGDAVTLNVKQIMSRKDYSHMQEEYRQFVESSRGKVFIARSYRNHTDGFSALFELDGVEKWLFWYGDLDCVKSNQAEKGE